MPKSSQEKNYAELKDELDSVMLQLQSETTDVDAALKLYQRGLELVQKIEEYLKTAENTVKELKAKFEQDLK
jgi:exodeoxyribonuclease VII small subunit